MKTIIKDCDCKHEGQDAIHGKGKRVKNAVAKKGEKQEYRCTVCRKVA